MTRGKGIGRQRFVDPAARRSAGAPGGHVADHLPELRAALEEQRRFRLEQLAELDTDAAHAVDAARGEVVRAVAAAAGQALLDVEIALALIEVGDYGRCRGCRTDIPLHLLRTIPTSRWCLDCRQHLTAVDGLDHGSVPQHELAAHVTSRAQGGHRDRRPRHARDATVGRRHHSTRRTAATP